MNRGDASKIQGCDDHPSVQQIAWVHADTGEYGELRLARCTEAEQFYRELKQKGVEARVGMEATGHSRWFERLLAALNFELRVGDPAQIRAKQVRKQKNDRRDAEHILKLMLENHFPRIWAPSPENRDLRQLLWHRHRLVGMRTRVMNQLQAIAINEGVRRKRGLWSQPGRAQLESLPRPPWTGRRRQELLELLDQFDPSIDELGAAIDQEAARSPEVQRLARDVRAREARCQKTCASSQQLDCLLDDVPHSVNRSSQHPELPGERYQPGEIHRDHARTGRTCSQEGNYRPCEQHHIGNNDTNYCALYVEHGSPPASVRDK
jgi:transposase